MENTAAKVITGKLTVIPAGHKVGPNKVPTWYRDENGNYHAEFFKATMGEPTDDGKFHSYTWNVSADEAEALANMPIGTQFTVTVRPKTETKSVVDDKGAPKQVTLPKVTPSKDGQTLFHEVVLVNIAVAVKGTIPRPRNTQYFADVKFDEDAARGESVGEG